MFPIGDDNERTGPAIFTLVLIAINVLVFLYEASLSPEALQDFVTTYGVIPDEIERGADLFTLVTAMFVHGGWAHLIGNMLFLWVFGDNVEDALGHFRFLVFYLACGVVGGLTHTLMMPTSELPLIGASGAVAGVIAAYLMLHPRVRIWVLVMRVIPIRISAAFALGAWIVTQLIMVLLPQVGPVAWWAHIGGLAAGAVLVVFMRRSGVPLFDRGIA